MLADQPVVMAPPDQLTRVAGRLRDLLVTGDVFDAIYEHILAVPGKRLRASLVLACARLLPAAPATVSMPTPSTLPARWKCFTNRRWSTTTSATVLC